LKSSKSISEREELDYNDFCFGGNMKTWIAVMTLLVAGAAQAKTIEFSCTPPNFREANKFAAEGVIEVDDSTSKAEGQIILTTKASGEDIASRYSAMISVEGDLTVIAKTKRRPFDVNKLTLTTDTENPFKFVLFLGLPESVSSSVKADGLDYRARCVITN
jgi:hypothetical protein